MREPRYNREPRYTKEGTARRVGSRPAKLSLPALFLALVLLTNARTAQAWGGVGHGFIARLAVLSLPAALQSFYTPNLEWFKRESSFPDRWRQRDKAEAPRHFLDGENFGFGTNLSKVPSQFAQAEKVRTYTQLRTDGMVPWTVKRHYQLLTSAFREHRWDDALIESAILSHYVADSHVPFHASANYDGQLSTPPQKGIHARFESVMLERSITDADLHPGVPTTGIGDPAVYTLSTLQSGLNQVQPILAIDKAAAAASGGEYNDAYWNVFTPSAKPIAIARLELGGRDLAGMILSAWNDAGSPTLPTDYHVNEARLPYAPQFVPRDQPQPPFMPVVSDSDKETARKRVEKILIHSKLLKKDVPFNLILPANYVVGSIRYPVLYLLHGANQTYNDWNDKSGIGAYTLGLPLIVVMPDANGNSWYTDSPGLGKNESFFLKELVPYIDKNYRTVRRREGRAIAGLSMGGYGAWRLAIDSPQTFVSAASLSGALNFGQGKIANWGPFAKSAYGNAPNNELEFSDQQLMPRIARSISKKKEWRGSALYFDVGTEDGLLNTNQNMERYLLENALPFEYAEFSGAHNWLYWDEHIRDVLQFTLRHLAAPEP